MNIQELFVQHYRWLIESAQVIEGGLTDEETVQFLRETADFLEGSIEARGGSSSNALRLVEEKQDETHET